jgi:hypothetical protein
MSGRPHPVTPHQSRGFAVSRGLCQSSGVYHTAIVLGLRFYDRCLRGWLGIEAARLDRASRSFPGDLSSTPVRLGHAILREEAGKYAKVDFLKTTISDRRRLGPPFP